MPSCNICSEELTFELSRKSDIVQVHCGCNDWDTGMGISTIPAEWPVDADTLYAACDNVLDSQ